MPCEWTVRSEFTRVGEVLWGFEGVPRAGGRRWEPAVGKPSDNGRSESGGWGGLMAAEGVGVRVVLADDQSVVREGLVTLLGLLPGIEVVGAAADGDEALRMVAEHRPDVL